MAARGAGAAGRAGAAHRRADEHGARSSGRESSPGDLPASLQALGWADGQNVRIDARGTSAIVENFRKHAAELVAATPDVVLAITTNAVLELQKASRTVPIVFTQVIDPVGSGLVRNLARPGGNVTGFLTFEYSISAKWL